MPKTSLKILHVLDHSLPFHSGYAFRSAGIFRAQIRKGWQPIGLTAPEHNKISKNRHCGDETVSGFRYYRTAAVSDGLGSVLAQCRRIAALARRIRQVVKIERPDLLHVHSPVLNALSALILKRAIALPIVYEVRAFWEDAYVDRAVYAPGSWKYKFTHALEMWACRKAEQVVVLCQGLKNELIEQGVSAQKLAVVSNGVNFDDFHPSEPDPECRQRWPLEGKQVIGFIGSFFRYEGLDLLVEAVARLRVTRPNLILLLVGLGDMKDALGQQIRRFGLGETVLMPGRIPHHRVPGVYALMDIVVYPRYSVRLTELVTPLKPLEAMAMGKAIVASDIGGHRELIQNENTGVLFAPGNLYALTETLAHLLDRPDLRKRYARQANTWVCANRSWDTTTAVYSEVYARALAG